MLKPGLRLQALTLLALLAGAPAYTQTPGDDAAAALAQAFADLQAQIVALEGQIPPDVSFEVACSRKDSLGSCHDEKNSSVFDRIHFVSSSRFCRVVGASETGDH